MSTIQHMLLMDPYYFLLFVLPVAAVKKWLPVCDPWRSPEGKKSVLSSRPISIPIAVGGFVVCTSLSLAYVPRNTMLQLAFRKSSRFAETMGKGSRAAIGSVNSSGEGCTSLFAASRSDTQRKYGVPPGFAVFPSRS